MVKYEQRVEVFRSRVNQIIELSGLNRSGFAKSIGVDRSTLSQLLSDSHLRLPRADTIAALAEQYEVSIDWLLGLTDHAKSSVWADPKNRVQDKTQGKAPNKTPNKTPNRAMVNTMAKSTHGHFEFEDFSDSSINEKMLKWHVEAEHYRVRYIPITLPELFKTEAVSAHEFQRYGFGRTEQRHRDLHKILIRQRRDHSQMEVCQSFQEIEIFAAGQGIWQGLSTTIRRQQLVRMIDLVEELYPNFRWYLFDGREIYTAAFTLFGPLKVAVFVGQAYLVLDDPDHVARFSKQFDQLIRKAVFQPHEIRSFIQDCLSRLDECG